jgi:hypothetical protein
MTVHSAVSCSPYTLSCGCDYGDENGDNGVMRILMMMMMMMMMMMYVIVRSTVQFILANCIGVESVAYISVIP